MKLLKSIFFSFLVIGSAFSMGDSNDPNKVERPDLKVVSALMDGFSITPLGQRYTHGMERAYGEHITLLHSLQKTMCPPLQQKLSSLQEEGCIFIMNDTKKQEMASIETPAFGTPYGIWINPDHLAHMPPEIASHTTQMALAQTEHVNYDFRKVGIYNGLIFAAGETGSHYIKNLMAQGKIAITPKQLKWARLGWYTFAPVAVSLTPLEKSIAKKLYRGDLTKITSSSEELRNIARYYNQKIACSSTTSYDDYTRLRILFEKRNLYLHEAERIEQEKATELAKKESLNKLIEAKAPNTDKATKAAFTECVFEKAKKQFGVETAERMLAMPCATQPLLSQCRNNKSRNNKRISTIKEASVQ